MNGPFYAVTGLLALAIILAAVLASLGHLQIHLRQRPRPRQRQEEGK